MYMSATKFACEIERHTKVHEEENEKKMMPESACEKKDA